MKALKVRFFEAPGTGVKSIRVEVNGRGANWAGVSGDIRLRGKTRCKYIGFGAEKFEEFYSRWG
jgi:hypothetical protein